MSTDTIKNHTLKLSDISGERIVIKQGEECVGGRWFLFSECLCGLFRESVQSTMGCRLGGRGAAADGYDASEVDSKGLCEGVPASNMGATSRFVATTILASVNFGVSVPSG